MEAGPEPSTTASAPPKAARPDAEVVAEKQPYYAKRIELFEQFRQREIDDLQAAKDANEPLEGELSALPRCVVSKLREYRCVYAFAVTRPSPPCPRPPLLLIPKLQKGILTCPCMPYTHSYVFGSHLGGRLRSERHQARDDADGHLEARQTCVKACGCQVRDYCVVRPHPEQTLYIWTGCLLSACLPRKHVPHRPPECPIGTLPVAQCARPATRC